MKELSSWESRMNTGARKWLSNSKHAGAADGCISILEARSVTTQFFHRPDWDRARNTDVRSPDVYFKDVKQGMTNIEHGNRNEL